MSKSRKICQQSTILLLHITIVMYTLNFFSFYYVERPHRTILFRPMRLYFFSLCFSIQSLFMIGFLFIFLFFFWTSHLSLFALSWWFCSNFHSIFGFELLHSLAFNLNSGKKNFFSLLLFLPHCFSCTHFYFRSFFSAIYFRNFLKKIPMILVFYR